MPCFTNILSLCRNSYRKLSYFELQKCAQIVTHVSDSSLVRRMLYAKILYFCNTYYVCLKREHLTPHDNWGQPLYVYIDKTFVHLSTVISGFELQ